MMVGGGERGANWGRREESPSATHRPPYFPASHWSISFFPTILLAENVDASASSDECRRPEPEQTRTELVRNCRHQE